MPGLNDLVELATTGSSHFETASRLREEVVLRHFYPGRSDHGACPCRMVVSASVLTAMCTFGVCCAATSDLLLEPLLGPPASSQVDGLGRPGSVPPQRSAVLKCSRQSRDTLLLDAQQSRTIIRCIWTRKEWLSVIP